MKDLEINNIWKSQDEKLDQLLFVNRQLLSEITQSKAKSALDNAKPVKYLGIILGIPYIIFLWFLVSVGMKAGGYIFATSFMVIAIISMIALANYIYHLMLIRKANMAMSIVGVQEEIVKIKTSTFQVLRFVFLQIPFWTTWNLSMDLIMAKDWVYIIVNLIIFILFVFAAIWLYKHLKIENVQKPWLKWMFNDSEWNSLIRAEEILAQAGEEKEEAK